jgi:3-hydroxyisobutyrate dehydrogenase
MRVGFIGLGEAGARYAADTAAAGHDVSGFDPAAPTTPDGVARVASLEAVVSGADLIIVLTGAALSPRIAEQAVGALRPGVVYADFTTASPAVMREVAALVEGGGAGFADVAILGPVPAKGGATETIVSGSAADDVAGFLRGLGSDVELIEGAAGEATARKLLRSVLMKSLQTVVVEAMAAGRAAGCEEWVHAQIAAQLSGDGAAKIARYEAGSRTHAVRRAHEMESVVEYLGELGVEADMSDASRRVLERLAAERG